MTGRDFDDECPECGGELFVTGTLVECEDCGFEVTADDLYDDECPECGGELFVTGTLVECEDCGFAVDLCDDTIAESG